MKHSHYLRCFVEILTIEHEHKKGHIPHGHNVWKYGDGANLEPLPPIFSRDAIALVWRQE